MNTVVVISVFVSLLALTEAATKTINCYNKESVSGTNKRIYTIAHGHDWGAYEYFDNGGAVTGFALDLIRKVCAMAGIDCRTVWDPYTNCVQSEAGQHSKPGQGLMDRWYDACTGWAVSVTRQSFFKFSQSFLKPTKAEFYVKTSDSSFNVDKWWDFRIGFLDGWVSDEKCLARAFNKVLPKTKITHYKTRAELKDAIINGQVDAGHASKNTMKDFVTGKNPPLKSIGQDHSCMVRGNSMMSRKDSDFPAKWNEGFTKLVSSGGFRQLCEDAKKEHNADDKGVIECV